VTPTSTRPRHIHPLLWLWGPVFAYCALIFALSSISGLPDLPAHMSDKVAHVLLYSGLGFLVARALSGGIGRPVSGGVVLAVLVAAAVYGLSDEVHQLFVPNRQFDLKDMCADAVGGVTGAGVPWLWGILRRVHEGA
jgi:VanZ family protein